MKKLLVFIKIPPPVTGITLMNQRVLETLKEEKCFEIISLGVTYGRNISNLGVASLRKILSPFFVLFRLLIILLKYKPDLVYFQLSRKGASFYRDFIYVLVMKFFRVKKVFHLRGQIKPYVEHNKVLKKLYKITLKNQYVVLNSELLFDDVISVYKDNPYYLYNGIEEVVKLSQINFEKNNNQVRIVYMSHLLIKKGILDLLNALSLINGLNIDFKLEIIGDQTKEISFDDLKKQIYIFGIADKVNIHGPKYKEEKYNIMQESDIFVFPTYDESFGNVAVEAMQCGLPVIATIEGSLPIIVKDNVSGLLYEKRNIKQLAEKIKILIENKDKRVSMAKESRKRYEELFTIDIFKKELISLIKKIVL